MTDPKKRIYLHLTATQIIIGAVPALLGVILGLMHFRSPIVSVDRQGILLVAIISLIMCAFFLWLLFAANSIAEDFQARHDALREVLDAILDLINAHARDSGRDFRSAMQRLHKACKKAEQANVEVRHLRSLFVEHMPMNGPFS